jgi:membrane associated rhomboid family serine protease
MSDTPHCYRHPDRETLVSCSECGRPICEDCMTFAPVGIRCPDHANASGVAPSPARTVRTMQRRAGTLEAPVTVVLIAINVLVFLITVAKGSTFGSPGGALFEDMWLTGVQVGDGDWYRLVTAMFLHASILHIAFNMLALWWLGRAVEEALGPWRYLLLYFVSGIAGSAGALLLSSPFAVTVGASGAIFGVMGSLLVLQYRATGTFAGPALTLIVLNLAFTFAIPGISKGGHIGGLIGGVLTTLAFDEARRRRMPALGIALALTIAAGSILVAYLRVNTTTL